MKMSELPERVLGNGLVDDLDAAQPLADAIQADRHQAGPTALHEFRRLGALRTGQP